MDRESVDILDVTVWLLLYFWVLDLVQRGSVEISVVAVSNVLQVAQGLLWDSVGELFLDQSELELLVYALEVLFDQFGNVGFLEFRTLAEDGEELEEDYYELGGAEDTFEDELHQRNPAFLVEMVEILYQFHVVSMPFLLQNLEVVVSDQCL